jgi:hypothetical protein
MMTSITIWNIRDTRDGALSFNHISAGYDPALSAPQPNCAAQRLAWSSRSWDGREGLLVDGAVFEQKEAAI